MTDKKITWQAATWLLAAVIIVAIIAGGIYLFAFNGAGGKSGYTLKASVNNDCTGTPWFVGEEQGFFKEAGLDFVNVGQTATDQRSTALALGQIDVLDVDPLTLINLRKSGANVVAIAQSGDSPADGDVMKEYMHWLVLNSSNITTFESIRDFNGTVRIGVSALGTSDDLQTDALLRKYGIPEDKIKYVVIPPQNEQQALRQHLIDVAVMRAAFYACAEHIGGVRIIAKSSDAFGSAGGTTLLITTESFIEKHPDTVRKFIIGYKAAERWCNANRSEAGSITAQHLGICTGVAHYYSESAAINDTQLQYWLDQMVQDGYLSPGEMKSTDLYTTQFNDTW